MRTTIFHATHDILYKRQSQETTSSLEATTFCIRQDFQKQLHNKNNNHDKKENEIIFFQTTAFEMTVHIKRQYSEKRQLFLKE